MEKDKKVQFLAYLNDLLSKTGFSATAESKKWSLTQTVTVSPGRQIIFNSQVYQEEPRKVNVTHNISVEGEGDVDGRPFLQLYYSVVSDENVSISLPAYEVEECMYLDEPETAGMWVYSVLGIKSNVSFS